jgi:acetyl-CoA carboxylase biotin carboxyl carrier protein
MNLKELKELVEFLKEQDIAEFELERGDLKVRVRRAGDATAPAPPQVIQIPAPPAAPVIQHVPPVSVMPTPVGQASVPASVAAPADEAHTVKSPIVGTYYDAPSPGSPPFVKIGDLVEAGQVLCIVEAMKLMNEIESDVAGEVIKKFATNGQPVEYGQALFAVRPK